MNCPNCGAFTATRTTDIVLGTRPSGTKLHGRGTYSTCPKCGWHSTPACATTDYARSEAEAGRLELAPELKGN